VTPVSTASPPSTAKSLLPAVLRCRVLIWFDGGSRTRSPQARAPEVASTARLTGARTRPLGAPALGTLRLARVPRYESGAALGALGCFDAGAAIGGLAVRAAAVPSIFRPCAEGSAAGLVRRPARSWGGRFSGLHRRFDEVVMWPGCLGVRERNQVGPGCGGQHVHSEKIDEAGGDTG